MIPLGFTLTNPALPAPPPTSPKNPEEIQTKKPTKKKTPLLRNVDNIFPTPNFIPHAHLHARLKRENANFFEVSRERR